MRYGFIKVATVTPEIKVADCKYNADRIIELIDLCVKEEVRIAVFPELCITGYTCGDLFLQDVLLEQAKEQLFRIAEFTRDKNIFVFAGLPLLADGRLFNTAAAIFNGSVIGFIPKVNIPNYAEFYEARHFASGLGIFEEISVNGKYIPFGSKILFSCENVPNLTLAAEICEDIWVPSPPSADHTVAGATVIANLSASDETTGKDSYRRELVKSQSARTICGYLYACSGEGESTGDLVFAGHNIVCENGSILKESDRFTTGITITELDLNRLMSERKRMSSFGMRKEDGYKTVLFKYSFGDSGRLPVTKLTRRIDSAPFVPEQKQEREKRCSEITMIQAMGLKKRLKHTKCSHAVVGISGGLDSTLALLVTAKAFDLAGIDRKQITAVTMPCFGTTDRTYHNAVNLIKQLGADFMEIPIHESVKLHFRDIGQDDNIHDVTYENAQARERTQVLMDIANRCNGLVIGTGDMSELALGWATYNGDHMSMYGVNGSVPKTLVKYLVLYFAETADTKELRKTLLDILDTPVSPELLPPKEGVISQKTEDLVGPYELHDFFLYYILRFGFTPSKVYYLAVTAFQGKYDGKTIFCWLKKFYYRFFSQQFKRSCLPDGPKVGSVAVSPRGDLRMPSDACVRLWIDDLEDLEKMTEK